MRLKYKVTFVYTIVVTIIILLLCIAVYLFSYQDRKEQFKERLYNKAVNTGMLMRTNDFDKEALYTINSTSASSLENKTVAVYDKNRKPLFQFHDDGMPQLRFSNAIYGKVRNGQPYYFTHGDRQAVAIYYKHNENPYYIVVAALDDNTPEWMSKLLTILIVCFLGSISVTIITGYFFSSQLVAPITRITQKVHDISTDDLSERLDSGTGKNELQQLAATINGLLDKLMASFDTQRRFISNASHELSTPLTAIISQLDVALQKERSSDDYRRVITSVKDDMRRLALLLKSLLEIAKASGSQGGIELSSVRIDEILMALPMEMKRISALYEVRLDFEDFPDSDASFCVYGNPALLYSALKNIVHNACKFSRTKIAYVYLGFTEKHLTISVQDDGPGIAPEDYHLIFQPFFRGFKQDNKIHGTGLGLALTNRIISLHKGSIVVDTELGKGSTFRVILPMET
jgi:signal transduction histidine kinase